VRRSQPAVGPLYCPGDQRVYFDLSFYRQMQQQPGGSGDFAWAYIWQQKGERVGRRTPTAGPPRPSRPQPSSNTSSGSAAETSAFGASTSSEIRSSAATLIST
jgi:predicted metalloprotease